MAQLLVRNLDDEVKARLRRRAARRGHSMEEEARDILRNALRDEVDSIPGLGSRIAARFTRLGLTGDLPELRGHVARPAKLK
jgi:antitoxin FitA